MERSLPSKAFCLQIKGPLTSQGLSSAIEGPLQSKCTLLLPSKGLCAIEGLLPSKGHCVQSALRFAIGGPFCCRKAFPFAIEEPVSFKVPNLLLSSKGFFQQRVFSFKVPLVWPSKVSFLEANDQTYIMLQTYSIHLTAATSSNLDSLAMQLFLTQLCQDSSASKKIGFCLLQLRKDFPLPSKDLSGRRDFDVPFPSPSKGIYLCHRRDFFAFKVHLLLPSKGLGDRRAFAIEGTLPSKCPSLHHRGGFAVEGPFPLPSKGLCLHSSRAFAIEGLLLSNCPSLCLRRAFSLKPTIIHV